MNEFRSDRPDPMMDELRLIRDEISANITKLSSAERINFHKMNAQKAAALRGKIFVPHPTLPFAEILVSKEQANQQ